MNFYRHFVITTLQQIGAWPSPRERLAGLVARITAAEPAALALDMLLADADPRSLVAVLKRRGVILEPDTLAALTRAAPDGDAMLAGVLAKVPGILGLVLDPGQAGHAPAAQVLLRGAGALRPLWRGAGVIGPHRPLMQAASGLGIIALPGDAVGVIRRLPLFITAGGAPYPGLALEILRVWQDASAFVVQGPPVAFLVGDRQLALPEDALLRLVPGRFDGPAIRHVSARDILSGTSTIPPDALVLIGGSAPALGGLRIAQDAALVPAVTDDPRISLWYGVDPLAEVYYDYGAYGYTANNPIKYIDPDGRGWYEDECGTPTFNKDLNSKEDFIKSGIKGSFIGNSALSIDDNGNQTSFNKDGTKTTSVQLDEVSVTAEKPQYGYYGGIWGQLNADKSAGAAFSDAGSEVMSELLSKMATFGVGGLGVKSSESFTILGSKKSSYSLVKGALLKVFAKLGIDGPLPKMKNGKWGSPQRGDQNKGYRLDNRGTPSSNNPNEQGAHINYWDYTKGKRKSGAGIKDAVRLK